MKTNSTRNILQNQEQSVRSFNSITIYRHLPQPKPSFSHPFHQEFLNKFGRSRESIRALDFIMSLNARFKIVRTSLSDMANKAGCSVKTIQRVLEWLRDKGLVNWARLWKQCNIYKFADFLMLPHVRQWLGMWLRGTIEIWRRMIQFHPPISISSTIKNWAIKNSAKSKLAANVQLLMLMDVIYLKMDGITPSRDPLSTASLTTMQSLSTEKDIQEQKSLKRESNGSIQSDTGLHFGDQRSKTHASWTSEAHGVSSGSHTTCSDANGCSPSSHQQIRHLIQSSIGLLQEPSHPGSVEEGRLSQKSFCDSRDRQDGRRGSPELKNSGWQSTRELFQRYCRPITESGGSV